MKFWSTLLLVASAILAHSQGDADLFRYSKNTLFGGARFEAMGGAFGAIGADLSSAQINPAGFGRFSKSQILGALSYGQQNTKSTFQGNNSTENMGLFNLNNAGVVLVSDDSKSQSGLIYTQFAAGYNRIQNFKNAFHYDGVQYESLLEDFASRAQGVSPEDLYAYFPFSTSMAWETYAINYDDQSNSYYALLSQGDNRHTRDYTQKGGMNEFFFSLSGNYMNALYFGANLGLRYGNYEEKTFHREELLDTTGTDLRAFDYEYHLKTESSGMNMKFGVVYLPINSLRIGLALHTPTFYDMADKYSANMTSYFKDTVRKVPTAFVPSGDYKYKLRTPTKFIGSIAYIFGTHGCLSADVEYINYNWAHFRTTDDPAYYKYHYVEENKQAKEVFINGLNARFGGEFVINSVLFLRAGFGLRSPAYEKSLNVENSWDKTYSTGFGIRWGKSALDVSLRRDVWSYNYTAFYPSVARLDNSYTSFAVGYTFYIL